MAGIKFLLALLLTLLAVISPASSDKPREFFVSPDGEDANSGLDQIGPRRVVVEGLAATGFNAVHYGDSSGTGIALDNAKDCVLRDCSAWMNGWGIRWDYILKGNPERINVSERNVGPSIEPRANPFDSLMLQQADSDYVELREPGTIVLAEEKDFDMAAEFADPHNHDYRLQAASRFRGTGPKGKDRGPFQFQANVFFVAPDGNDSANGLAVAEAWKTLERATKSLRPGDTLYLLPGTYRLESAIALRGEEGKPVRILGRGPDLVVIQEPELLAKSRNLEFGRLHFENGVRLEEEVLVRTSGAPDAPITFRAAPGEKVILSAGQREFPLAFGLASKHHLRFDGFYLIGKRYTLYKSRDVEISRCYAGPYRSKYTPPLLNAPDCADLTVSNCVSLSAKSGPALQGCTGRIRIEHNVFFEI